MQSDSLRRRVSPIVKLDRQYVTWHFTDCLMCEAKGGEWRKGNIKLRIASSHLNNTNSLKEHAPSLAPIQSPFSRQNRVSHVYLINCSIFPVGSSPAMQRWTARVQGLLSSCSHAVFVWSLAFHKTVRREKRLFSRPGEKTCIFSGFHTPYTPHIGATKFINYLASRSYRICHLTAFRIYEVVASGGCILNLLICVTLTTALSSKIRILLVEEFVHT